MASSNLNIAGPLHNPDHRRKLLRPISLSETSLARRDNTDFIAVLKQEFGIEEQALQLVFEVCKLSGEKLGDALVRMGYLSDDDRQRCRALQWGLPFMDLDESPIRPVPADVVPTKTFERYRIAPLSWDGNTLTVAISDPLDLRAVDDLRALYSVEVNPVIATEEQITRVIDATCTSMSDSQIPELSLAPLDDEVVMQDAVDRIRTNLDPKTREQKGQSYQVTSAEEEGPAIRLVNSILVRAIRAGASDIHIQPEPDAIRVRLRVDGILRDGTKLPVETLRPLVARLKVMSQLDLTETRSPQDGRINLRMEGKSYHLRLSLVPSVTGTSVVIRIAAQSEEELNLENIGLGAHDYKRFKQVVERPLGLVLITGPTGSGKSTTLYASLGHLNQAEQKILTIEDPVERQVAGITQMEVNEKNGMAFADGLRSSLRHNPDVIMVGEIRDAETAMIAVQASLTGHLVFSTLHTNDAASAVTRLVNMGVDPFLVASSLGGVMAQRLVRVLCPDCKGSYEVDGSALGDMTSSDSSLLLYRKTGCEKCGNTGYVGREPVFELLLHSPSLEQLILQNAADTAIRQKAVEEGMRTLQQEIARKVREGRTSVEEALRVVQSRWAYIGEND
ncbi:MAG: GspE/PulE family protein [Planctomycetota bacterium]|jgi:type IV pilus assembly protein PilB|nr:GspE/PulE family protein [Planctomycetota bacterium]